MRGSGRQSRTVSRPARSVLVSSTFALAIAGTLSPRLAHADEPISAREPRLMQETGENTTVIDAFDKDDPFDANLLLTLRQQWKTANIRRETSLSQPGLSSGGFVAS